MCYDGFRACGEGDLARVNVEAMYIELGSPWENGYAESFHSRLRDEFLAVENFESLMAAQKQRQGTTGRVE